VATPTNLDVIAERRRAAAAFTLTGVDGAVVQRGDGEAVIHEDALHIGPVKLAFLDCDALRIGDYRIELDLWPSGQLVLTQLGRRFDTFSRELRGVRNQARVSGLLAHGITMPELFEGALPSIGAWNPTEFQLYDTHLTIVPEDGDPWQIPLGAVNAVRMEDDPPTIELETYSATVVMGQLARRRDAFHQSIVERLEAQRQLLAKLTEQDCFADGRGVLSDEIEQFEDLLHRFTASDRTPCARLLLPSATDHPRLGFVKLLDPGGEAVVSPVSLPEHWSAFLLVPVGPLTVLEILAGPAAATYVFRAGIEAVNRDLQTLHFRRAPLALTPEQAVVTPENPYRLALRRLVPLQRLRACTSARLIHNSGWERAFQTAVG
jgi:hypothetical protein